MSEKRAYTLEFPIRTNAKILYDFISTSHGLSQWFADHVDNNDGTYVFTWDGNDNTAKIVEVKAPEFIRFKWEDSAEGEYFEFKIIKNEITGDTALVITDFAAENEKEEQKLLWDSQINTLTLRIGG
ncbi:MAG: hypothetical protein IIA45_12915 [Bacteroidetes bacterium]|nr:hypothetical protein [Bacteroidota bacterium]